ncbi:MAG: D-tyrosyl-tRNA(Tyr) deacylase [Desulfobulbaceae bacterium]|nr:MAG: D-tyrosyl-tRNA(Tyr) deacylase [Desulfobulbaceae bacterium]
MRAVIQRVKSASVSIGNQTAGSIGYGLLVLLGIRSGDSTREIHWLADKIVNLRIFPDEQDKMNCSLLDLKAQMLIVSQFTLYGDCRKGRRPGYSAAAPPQIAEELYEQFVQTITDYGVITETGKFQAKMEVALINDGPVTLLLDSDKQF